MNYTAQFKNINEILYEVDFDINNGINGTSEIILSDDPFKVEYNSSEDLYEPLKLSNATCTIVSDSYLFDLYQSTAQGCKLTLTNKNTDVVEWVGYVTPNLYTQGFEQNYEAIEIEAIDGLSVLENYQYTTIDNDNKKVKSFEQIIINIIKKCNCYKNIYINQNNYLVQTATDYTSIIDKLFIAEQNFFNNDYEPATPTTAEAPETTTTCKAILEEIVKYLGCTMLGIGDSVYIIDYDYIVNSNTNYTKYSTSNNFTTYTKSQVTLSNVYNITNESFKASGSKIELTDTYNQIGIEVNLNNNNEELLPDFFDNDSLSNITYSTFNWTDTYSSTWGTKTKLLRFYDNINYNFKWYENDTNWNESQMPKPVVISRTVNSLVFSRVGALILKQTEIDTADGIPANVSFSDYIVIFRNMSVAPTEIQNIAMPIFSNTLGKIPENSFLFNDKYYLVINTSSLWSDDFENIYIDNSTERRDDIYWSDSDLYITAKLKIGNRFWDGTNWTATDSTFKIIFDRKEEKHLINKWFDIKNTITYDEYIGETGQKIPIRESDQLVGDVTFTLYTPKFVGYSISKLAKVFLKDLSIKIVKQKITKNDDTDTLYQNVIDDDYINEFSNLDFKVNSQTNKGISYSSVIEFDPTTSKYKYNQSIFNKSLNKTQLQEYNIIEKYVNQYSKPRKKLNITLANDYKPYSLFTIDYFQNEKFVVNNMSIDYFNDKNEISIIEKVQASVAH